MAGFLGFASSNGGFNLIELGKTLIISDGGCSQQCMIRMCLNMASLPQVATIIYIYI